MRGCVAREFLTKADSQRDLRDLIPSADADAAEKARRERLLHHNTHCRVKIQFS